MRKAPHLTRTEPSKKLRRRILAILAGGSLIAGQAAPAFATIDNTATVYGTHSTTDDTTGTSNTVTVPVQTAAPALTLSVSLGSPQDVKKFDGSAGTDGVIGAGDTIEVTYTATNTGNVTLTGVTPVQPAASITFNNVQGTGSLGSFTPQTVAPGAHYDFVVTYTLSAADAYRAAGISTGTGAAAKFLGHATGTYNATGYDSADANNEVAIPANPKLQVAKAYSITTDNGTAAVADKDDVVTYTYTVTNVGNVPVANVHVEDNHEGTPLATGTVTAETQVSTGPVGSNSDAAANAVWDNLTAGSVVSFTYVHTVTQTEVDGG